MFCLHQAQVIAPILLTSAASAFTHGIAPTIPDLLCICSTTVTFCVAALRETNRSRLEAQEGFLKSSIGTATCFGHIKFQIISNASTMMLFSYLMETWLL